MEWVTYVRRMDDIFDQFDPIDDTGEIHVDFVLILQIFRTNQRRLHVATVMVLRKRKAEKIERFVVVIVV